MTAIYKGKTRLKDPKEEAYCNIYADTLNGTQSAMQVGYGGTYASSAQYSKKLRKDERVQLRIQFILAKNRKELNISKPRILKEVSKIAYSDIMGYIDINKLGTSFKFNGEEMKRNGGAIQEVSMQGGKSPKKGIKLYDKLKALDQLAKYEMEQIKINMQIEKHEMELEGKGENNIEVGDDGFIEAMQYNADSFDNDYFVITEGKDDEKEDILKQG